MIDGDIWIYNNLYELVVHIVYYHGIIFVMINERRAF